MVSAKPEFPDAGPADGAFEPDEGADNAAIRIVLADSQAIYRVGIRKIFALEDDIRVIAQVDTLAGLHSAIQRFPTDMILLEGNLIAGTIDAIPELVRRAPQLKIIVQSAQNDETNTVELVSPWGSRHYPSFHLARSAGQVRAQNRRRRDVDR